jgi:hypothetical protein
MYTDFNFLLNANTRLERPGRTYEKYAGMYAPLLPDRKEDVFYPMPISHKKKLDEVIETDSYFNDDATFR